MKHLTGVLTLLLLAVPTCAQTSVSGEWSGSIIMQAPNGQVRSEPVALMLEQAGENLSGKGGPNSLELLPIKRGKIAENRLTLELEPGGPMTQLPDYRGMTLSLDLRLFENELKGEIKKSQNGRSETGRVYLKRRTSN